jgi:hypothetical protein
MPGFNHSPQNDIENLRDLLKGYGDAGSIIKELIQNAEDADATRFELLYLEPDPTSKALHPLLPGPALCAVNNGVFEMRHKNAVFSIGSGTKADDERRIGRFGKGLKSVFALSEAFFLIGSPDITAGWSERSWIMNPFAGWRHQDWEDTHAGEHAAKIYDYFTERLAQHGWRDGNWLAFWLPLRQDNHLKDDKGSVAAIHRWGEGNHHPGDNPIFPREMRSAFQGMSDRVLLLRTLKEMTFRAAGSTPEQIIFKEACVRPRATTDETKEHWIHGEIAGTAPIFYFGLTGRLSDKIFSDYHKRANWPLVGRATEGNETVQSKGQPHFGCVFSFSHSQAPSLKIQWSVFLPVKEQPESNYQLDQSLWPHGLTLTLHGCFFLDSTRTYIDGLNGEGFNKAIENFREDRVGANLTVLEWNRSLAGLGPLSHLPRVLAKFLSKHHHTDAQICDLIRTLRKSQLWTIYGNYITSKKLFIRKWTGTGEKFEWTCIDANEPVLSFPCDDCGLAQLAELFPGLKWLAARHALIFSKETDFMLIGPRKCRSVDESELLGLIEDLRLTDENREVLCNWMLNLKKNGHMTPTLLQRLGEFPLVQVVKVTNNATQWLTTDETREWVHQGRLYCPQDKLRKVAELVQDTELFSLSNESWVSTLFALQVSALSRRNAAEVILRSRNILQHPAIQAKIIDWLLQNGNSDEPLVRVAARYLLHRNYDCRNDSSTSLVYASTSTDAALWERFLRQLLGFHQTQGNWRIIAPELVQYLTKNALSLLNTRSIDARGCFEECFTQENRLSSLVFDEANWEKSELRQLIAGFYSLRHPQHDPVRILRRLPIHTTVRTDPNDRVAIADEKGELAKRILLFSPGFDQDITADLKPIWEAFLGELTLIERYPAEDPAATAQRACFKSNGEDAELSWWTLNHTILDLPNPQRFGRLVLLALEKGGGAAMRGLGARIGQAELFQLDDGTLFSTSQIYQVDGLEDDLHELLRDEPGVLSWKSLPAEIRKNPGYSANRNSLSPQREAVFKRVSEVIQANPYFQLGIPARFLPGDWLTRISELSGCPDLPIAGMIERFAGAMAAVPVERFEAIFKPSLGQDWPASDARRYTNILNWLAGQQRTEWHDCYLKQCVRLGIEKKIVPLLRLQNRVDDWLATSDLVWPTEGLELRHQLSLRQEKILLGENALGGGHQSQQTQERQLPELNPSQLPNRAANERELVAYLEFFKQCDDFAILVGAFVAVCFNSPGLLEYADECLRPENQTLPHLRDLLFSGEGAGSNFFEQQGASFWETGIFVFRFVDAGEQVAFETVAGGQRTFVLGENNSSLLADTRRLAKPLGCYQGKLVRELILQRRSDLDGQNLHQVWRRTLLLIVLHGYGLVNTYCPNFTSFEKLLGKAFPLRRVQRMLLSKVDNRLKELRCHGIDPFTEIAQMFDIAIQHDLDGDDYADQQMSNKEDQSRRLARKLTQEAQKAMEKLIGEEAPEKKLLTALCRKLKEYGYSERSTLLELFQNADDALAERAIPSREDFPRTFCLEWGEQAGQVFLNIAHWGRPINSTLSHAPDSNTFRRYTRDLEKMLSLNLSDKADSHEVAGELTGRFGLGFKSVFFYCDRPLIRSNRLRCRLRAGFYPENAVGDDAARLETITRELSNPEDVTLYHLSPIHLDRKERGTLQHHFREIAPYLVHCARAVHRIEIREPRWTGTFQRAVTENTAPWHFAGTGFQPRLWIVPHEENASGRAAWIFSMNERGFVELPEGVPQIWATAPMGERSGIRCLVNGDWLPDAGRQQLARDAEDNEKAARKLASHLKVAVQDLLQQTTRDWNTLRNKLTLNSGTEAHSFWESFWRLVSRDQPVRSWTSVATHKADITNAILWNEDFGALRSIARDSEMVPSLLPAAYRLFICASRVNYFLRGALASQQDVMQRILGWAEFQAIFPPGQVVAKSVGEFLNELGCTAQPSRPVQLKDVLQEILKGSNRVSVAAANRLGEVFTPELKKRLNLTDNGAEMKSLIDLLQHLEFPNSVGGGDCVQVTELLVRHTVSAVPEIEVDERRRAAFAPDESIVTDQLNAEGLRFFALCRSERQASSERLATWAHNAEGLRLRAVFDYLYDGQSSGKRAQPLASALGKDWLVAKAGTETYRALPQSHKLELRRLFGLGDYSAEIGIPLTTYLDPLESFQRIHDWWCQNQREELERYLDRVYGSLRPEPLAWRNEDAWGEPGDSQNLEARRAWMVLFVHASLHAQGWSKPGCRREFIAFFNQQGWLDTLARDDSLPADYIGILDKFLGDNPGAIRYYHSMRQFISFYASSQNLDKLVDVLFNLNRKARRFPLRQAFSIGDDPEFAGTGIEMPSFERGFGLGAHFVVRELLRMGRLNNDHAWEHGFVLTRSLRYFSKRVFNPPNFDPERWSEGTSTTLYQHLKTLSNGHLDPTFGHCFDIPLGILAESPDLQETVLGEAIPTQDDEPDTTDEDQSFEE